ncbi:hypothetical protein CLCR_04721 [Cladophialophora carrionii]|uniref:FAD-binding FR-type domain-containing protein n=1 Tax=Cladophialophora carrionii TaxID=86049 RepID=A0A1C1CKK4_9EURO|nr:hypothetical protein CLCR_04721 [Cladophialophora carrionii]
MDFSEVYAIAIGAVFGAALLLNGWPWISRCVRPLSPLTSKYLVYRYVLHRHRFMGPWSLAGVLLQLIYVTGNILCIALRMRHGQTRISTLSQAGQRAGTLSIINLIPLFAGLHLSALSDLLGVNLRTVRQIHRSAGVMASLLMVFHALVALRSQPTFALNQAPNLFGVIALAALVVFAVWRHLPSGSSFARDSLYSLNGFFRPGRAGAEITHVYGAIRLRIQCRKPVQFQLGQYVNLWMPSLPYLKRLIRGYNVRRLRAQRVHLVWQIRDLNLALAAETLLNGALDEDTLDDGWILDISIYCAQDDIPRTSFGKRAHVFAGPAPLGEIFQAERAGRSTEKKRMQQVDWNTQRLVSGDDIEYESTVGREVNMLVTVSATDEVRDNLRQVVRDHLSEEVQFFELDY